MKCKKSRDQKSAFDRDRDWDQKCNLTGTGTRLGQLKTANPGGQVVFPSHFPRFVELQDYYYIVVFNGLVLLNGLVTTRPRAATRFGHVICKSDMPRFSTIRVVIWSPR